MKYLIYYQYDDHLGGGRNSVEASSVEEAVNAVLKSIGTHSHDEDANYRLNNLPTIFSIAEPQPLKPEQHPETPPLYKTKGVWRLRWHLIFEAEKEL